MNYPERWIWALGFSVLLPLGILILGLFRKVSPAKLLTSLGVGILSALPLGALNAIIAGLTSSEWGRILFPVIGEEGLKALFLGILIGGVLRPGNFFYGALLWSGFGWMELVLKSLHSMELSPWAFLALSLHTLLGLLWAAVLPLSKTSPLLDRLKTLEPFFWHAGYNFLAGSPLALLPVLAGLFLRTTWTVRRVIAPGKKYFPKTT